MSPAEAQLWATGIKLVTDMIAMATKKPVTLETLEKAIAEEEIRAMILKSQRDQLKTSDA